MKRDENPSTASPGNHAGRKASARAILCLGVVLVLYGALAGRLANIQHFRRHEKADNVEEWIAGSFSLAAPRGRILDAEGRDLAVSVRRYGCALDPGLVHDLYEPLKTLQGVLDLSRPEMEKVVNYIRNRRGAGRDCRFVWIRKQLTRQQMDVLKSMDIDGVFLVPLWSRNYPQGRAACHVIGFTGRDGEGLEGLEMLADGILHPQDGMMAVGRDARRRMFVPDSRLDAKSGEGQDLVLTIDSYIQHLARDEIDRIVKKYKPESATAVVMDPFSGDLVALANYPDYDLNEAWSTDPSLRLNPGVAAIYEPGSVFKPFILSAALDTGAVSLDTRIFCENGTWNTGYRVLHDSHGYGWLTAAGVVVKSSNIGIAKVAQKIGMEGVHDYLSRFGFGRSTGSGLPGEVGGIFRPLEEWNPRFSMSSIPMGHEVSVTPLQLATAFSAIVNGGMLMQPRVVRAVIDPATGEREELPLVPVRRVVGSESADKVRKIMGRVVSEGTGRHARSSRYALGGKTGTAQIPGPGGYVEGEYIATFCGFAPLDAPRLVVLVSVTKPKGAYYGGTVSAPAVKSIMEKSLLYLKVPPRTSGYLASSQR